jgi:Flp pilus assembly protein TadD
VFALGDTVTVFAQAFSAPTGATTHFELVAGDVVQDHDTGTLIGELSTLGLESGVYAVHARLVDADGSTLDERQTALTLSPRSHIPRPGFVYRRGFNTRVPGLLALVRGEQLWRLSRFDQARDELEAAVAAANPELPQARWKLATEYLRRGNARDALALLAPMEQDHPDQFEVVAGLGLSFYLQADYARAVGYLERAAAIRPPDTSLWNALGDSYQRLGNTDEARRAFERSLALDPNQDAVSRRLAR